MVILISLSNVALVRPFHSNESVCLESTSFSPLLAELGCVCAHIFNLNRLMSVCIYVSVQFVGQKNEREHVPY